jgi:hypothetical protein
MGDFEKEIEEMLEGFAPGDGDAETAEVEGTDGTTEEVVEEVAKDEPVEESVEAEVPADEPRDEAKEVETQVEPAAEVAPVEAEPEQDELSVLRSQNQALMDQINALAEAIQQGPQQQAPQQQAPQVAPQQGVAPEGARPKFSLLEGVEFEDVVTNPQVFERTMARMANFIQQATYANIVRTLPVTVTQLVSQTSNAQKLVDQFYVDNKDLKPVQKFVGKTMNQLANTNPDWDMPKLFDETAKAARKALGLTTVAKPKSPPPAAAQGRKLPAFAKGGGSQRGGSTGPVASGQKRQILDLLS